MGRPKRERSATSKPEKSSKRRKNSSIEEEQNTSQDADDGNLNNTPDSEQSASSQKKAIEEPTTSGVFSQDSVASSNVPEVTQTESESGKATSDYVSGAHESSQNTNTVQTENETNSSETGPSEPAVVNNDVKEKEEPSIQFNDFQDFNFSGSVPTSISAKPTPEQLGIIEDENGFIKISNIGDIEEIVISPAPPPSLSDDFPDSRLIITDLFIENFKSYAGYHHIANFEKNFTAVVGPNGSGKSNVIDSLLFVFGNRANKIRSAKTQNLIHKSDKYPNQPYCSVAVNFATIKDKKNDQYEIIPDSGFSIKRITYVNKSNSDYKINGKSVTYTEVVETLKAYGIDLNYNRFLILQGEIEAISLMNPTGDPAKKETGMLQYVEDIIGSNRYIEPINKLSAVMKELEEEEVKKIALLRLTQKERDDLEGPKNQAIEYLRLENKLFLTENSLYHLHRMDAEEQLVEVSEKKTNFSNQLASLKEEMDSLRLSKKNFESDMQKSSNEYEAFAKKCEEDKQLFGSYEQEDMKNLEELKNEKRKLADINENIKKNIANLEKLKKQVVAYENETSELEIKKTKVMEEKSNEEKKMSGVMDSLKKETNALQEKKDTLEAELIKCKDHDYKIKSEIDIAQSEFNIFVSTEKVESEKLTELTSNHDASVQASQTEEKILKEEENKIIQTAEELAFLHQQLDEARNNEELLIQQVKKDRYKVEEARNTMNASSYQGKIMQAFTSEKAKGRLKGVYGRLGDLGAIDEKYDVAISTACGQLDNIVTDTLNTAQECVEFLKKGTLGYTTFIPLDKMAVWEQHANTKIRTPENVPRLFDLIRVNDKNLLPAFYFALKNTLVAADLDQATRIGMGGERHRIVTLAGEIIDTAGTMSGGGKKMSGRMGQTVLQSTLTSADIEKMDEELRLITHKLSEVKKMRINLEETISQKNNLLSSLQHSVKKRKLHCNAYKDSINMLIAQISQQKIKAKEATVDKRKIKELEEKIKETTKKYNLSSQETSVIEGKVSKLQEEIVEISKGKFSKVKKSLDQMEKKLGEVTKALTISTVNMKTSKRNIKKAEDKVNSLENEKEKSSAKLQEVVKYRDSMTIKGLELQEKINADELKLDEYKQKRKNMKGELDSLVEKEHKLKSTEIELRNNYKTYESKETEKRALIKHLNVKISKLKLNEIEDDTTEFPELSKEEISKLSVQTLTSDIEITKVKLEEKKPDLSAINEYKKKSLLCDEKQKDVNEISAQKMLQTGRHEELRKRRISEFLKGLAIINSKLHENYQMLSLGRGNAELELLDSFDPFSKGIEFSVKPLNKSWKNIRNLSGGEKTLSSIALVFALHYYRPTPFYVMDEIDAALDERNVAIVGLFLKEKTVNTQFIIVSLRNVMNELTDQLLGIFKVNNCTKHLMLRNSSKWTSDE